MIRTRWLPAALAASILAGACGGSSADSSSNDTDAGRAARTTVMIGTFAFRPKTLTVKAGDTVRWVNDDDIVHTVTSGTREYDPTNSGLVTETNKDGMFDRELDGKGATARFTFSEPGSYHYFCDRHPGMEVDIEVR